jgi:hypothetical protein
MLLRAGNISTTTFRASVQPLGGSIGCLLYAILLIMIILRDVANVFHAKMGHTSEAIAYSGTEPNPTVC